MTGRRIIIKKGCKLGNKYEDLGEYVIGYCSNGKQFIFDRPDYEKVGKYTWRFQESGIYTTIRNGSMTKALSLSHLITGTERHHRVFFRDKDPLNYRRDNLYNGNEYIDCGSFYKVLCFDGQYFFIDKTAKEVVQRYSWHVSSQKYVLAKAESKTIKLHRLIMNLYPDGAGKEVDHMNRNPRDNRFSNLRIVTRSENCLNRNLLSTNISGTCGVYWSISANKWCAQINKNGKRIYLGCYGTKGEAIIARRQAEESI